MRFPCNLHRTARIAWSAGRTLHALVLGVGGLVAGAGCHDPTAARQLSGTYTLRAVGGRPLPHVLASGRSFAGGTETISVLASTFHFEADGSVRREMTLRNVSDVPARDTVHTLVHDLSYRRAGARVRIGTFEPCPPTALCSGPMTGRLVGGRLDIESGGRQSVRYEYVAID